MARRSLLAAVSFAHLLGIGAASRRAEDEDEDRKDGRRAEDEDGDGDENTGKRGRRAEDDDRKDDDADAEDDDKKDDDEPRSKKGKGRRAAEDDDDADAADDKDEDAKAARGRERSRCAAIFASKAAGRRPDLAAHFAFNTGMSRRDAIAALEATVAGMPEPKAPGLDERMGGFGGMRSSADAPPRSRGQAVQSSWDDASARAGISVRR